MVGVVVVTGLCPCGHVEVTGGGGGCQLYVDFKALN